MTVDSSVNDDMRCPKCGSSMIERKIWRFFKSTEILQCEVCKYYLVNEKSGEK